jgi:hypothetical protein
MEENKVDLVSQLYPQQEQPETTQEVEQESIESIEVPTEQPKDHKQSWKELRDKADLADRYQRERDEYYRVLKQLEEQAYLQQQQGLHASGTQEDADDSFDLNNIPDDDFLSGKDLKKVIAKQQRSQQKQYEEMMRQQKMAHEKMVENDFKAKYNDFYDVVNTDNIAKLRELRPGLARSLHLNPDIKEKAEETYLAIKDLGIYRRDDFTKQKEVAQKNFSKPRSVNSVGPQTGDSPLNQANAFANGLTKELKKSLYQEMLDKAGNY